jgi:hypothetical protein
MQNCNVENLTLLIPPPKMQEKVARLSQGPYTYELLNGQKFVTLPKVFEKKQFHNLVIDFGVIALQVPSSPDYLTLCEAADVEASLAEIKAGKAKKFKSVGAFLKELKE